MVHSSRNATLTVCRRLFSLNLKDIQDPYQMFNGLGTAVNEVMPPFMKMIGVIVIAGIVGNTLLGGYNFTWYGASFRISKLDPMAGIKRMFGVQSLVELIKSILKSISGRRWRVHSIENIL
ncbi:MAG: EscU/YscU/HrcU family type III secretion system export apparatus switch protein [Rheinheimera sp.]|nr:EscU/YscU/HrcU family type III secretion system export apparatus switch protein [Rheinheimera sp.]